MVTTESTPFWAIALTFGCSILGAVGQAFFKAGSRTLEAKIWSLATNWQLLTGLAAYAFATVLFIIALKYGRLSTLYPVIAMSYVWVFLISWFYFKEFQNRSIALNMAGVAFILAGVILIAMGR